jgi:hypothetical protein
MPESAPDDAFASFYGESRPWARVRVAMIMRRNRSLPCSEVNSGPNSQALIFTRRGAEGRHDGLVPESAPGAPCDRDDPHAPLCAEAGPGPTEVPGRPAIATTRMPRFVRKPARGPGRPVRGTRTRDRRARNRFIRRGSVWIRSARRTSADRKTRVLKFARTVLQVFRILSAHIHFPHRVGPREATVSNDSRPENG